MTIELTEIEKAEALDYAAKLNRRADQWRYYRWLAIACFMFGIALLIAADRLSDRIHTQVKQLDVLSEPDSVTPEVNQRRIDFLQGQLELKEAMFRAEISIYIKVLIVVIIGIGIFCHALSNWNRDRKDRLFAKLLVSIASQNDRLEVKGNDETR